MIHEFTGTGVSPWFRVSKEFNVDVYGDGVGTVLLEKTYNGGTDVIQTEELTKSNPMVGYEIDRIAKYRFRCSAYTSGTLKCRAK